MPLHDKNPQPMVRAAATADIMQRQWQANQQRGSQDSAEHWRWSMHPGDSGTRVDLHLQGPPCTDCSLQRSCSTSRAPKCSNIEVLELLHSPAGPSGASPGSHFSGARHLTHVCLGEPSGVKPARKLHTAERSALQGSIDAGNVQVRGDRQTKTETTGNTCTAKYRGKAHGQFWPRNTI